MTRPGPGDVLVLRALGLGDALTGVPALRGLRRAWPGRRLWLAAPAAPGSWLRDLGVVDEVLPTDGLRAPLAWRGAGHTAVNLHGRGPDSHALLTATRPGRLVAFATAGHPGPDWRPDEHEVDRWCRLVRSIGGACGREDLRLDPAGAAIGGAGPAAPALHRGEVLLHPGAASGSRRWPAGRWAELADRLLAAGHRVTLTGGPGERELCGAVVARSRRPGLRSTAGELALPELADRVAAARLLVCGDTGVAHLATALGTPSVLLFGPTPPDRWGPAIEPDLHAVLWRGSAGDPGDPHGHAIDPALAAIGVDEVLAAAAQQLRTAAALPAR